MSSVCGSLQGPGLWESAGTRVSSAVPGLSQRDPDPRWDQDSPLRLDVSEGRAVASSRLGLLRAALNLPPGRWLLRAYVSPPSDSGHLKSGLPPPRTSLRTP